VILLSFLISLFYTGVQAQQAESVIENNPWRVRIQEDNSFDEQGLQFLKWSNTIYFVKNNGYKNYVEIVGQFKEPVKKVLLNNKEQSLNTNGSITLKVLLNDEKKLRFNIFATSMDGVEHKMQYTLTPFNQKQVEKLPAPSFWRISAGSGITLLSYRQQRVVPFSQYAITIKGSISYRIIPEKVDIGVSSFYNLIPFGSTSPKGYQMQYLGVNTRVGYILLRAPSGFRINLNAGWYFNTSMSTIGFGNMFGPQLYPEFSYIFNNGHSILLYGKFSPALSSESVITFSDNREVAMGTHYSFPISDNRRLSIGLDFSQLKISVSPNWGCTNTYSLSAGITL
jgi:hypothetical protein